MKSSAPIYPVYRQQGSNRDARIYCGEAVDAEQAKRRANVGTADRPFSVTRLVQKNNETYWLVVVVV